MDVSSIPPFIVVHGSRPSRGDCLSFRADRLFTVGAFPLKGAQHAGRGSYVRRKACCE